MSETIKAIDESNVEDEVLLCLPSKESPKYSNWEFTQGIKDKTEWLRQKMKDYGYVGHIAYDSDGKPLGFVEFISSKSAPLPIEEAVETTAIIT